MVTDCHILTGCQENCHIGYWPGDSLMCYMSVSVTSHNYCVECVWLVIILVPFRGYNLIPSDSSWSAAAVYEGEHNAEYPVGVA